MASTALKECIGNWKLFLLGLLLSISPVLGQVNPTTAPTSSGAVTTTTTTPSTSSGAVTTTTTTPSTSSGAVTTPTTTAAISSGAVTATSSGAVTTTTTAAATSSGAVTTTTTTTVTTSGATPTTTTASSTSSGAGTTTTAAAVTSSGATPTTTTSATTSPRAVTATTTGSTSPPISMSTGVSTHSVSSGMTLTTSSTSMGGNTGGMTNGTTGWGNSSMSNIYCPSFMCNYSDCYSMYKSQNATMCPSGYNYCELIRQVDACYTVSCSASCSMSCSNTSESNCTVHCCNSTDCLNDTFASMMMPTTPAMTTTSATTTHPTTPTTTTAPTTQGGNKCHTGKCNGTDCYTTFNTPLVCSASQPHCQLKKETVGTAVQWTAGCTTNCSGQTSCKASTQPPCHLECCNATVTSCLWLNGTLNVPSFATRGPQLHSQLVTSVLVIFAISLML